MLRRTRTWLTGPLAAVAALACAPAGSGGKGDGAPALRFDGKGDIYDRVDDRGPLAFGEARDGAFVEDLELHAYRIAARAGAVITVDHTHAGSQAKLDTLLYLFGPWDGGGFGGEAIAVDDDSGWGAHARLERVEIPRSGEYLAVLTTFDGQGRGTYRLEASCATDDCAAPALPALADTCHPAFVTAIRACVDSLGTPEDPSEAPMGPGDAIVLCTDAEPLAPTRDALCAAAAPPAFCTLDYESFVAHMAPVCAGALALELHADVLGLVEEPTPQPSLEALDCGPGCALTYATYFYRSGVGTATSAIGGVWRDVTAACASNDVTLDFAPGAMDPEVRELVDELIAQGAPAHGPEEVAWASSPDTPGVTVVVVHLPASRRVVVVTIDTNADVR